MVKNPPVKPEDLHLIPGSGRSPGEGNGYPLQHFCLENSMGRGALQATVHGQNKYMNACEQVPLEFCSFCIVVLSILQLPLKIEILASLT